MSDFDLRRAIRAILDETDLATPDEIAAKVAESIPTRDLRSILTLVLRDYVRVELGRHRMDGGEAPAKASKSAKVRAIRDAAPGWLRERVFVGDSQWLLLGDCSYDNLKYLEAERLQNAARSAAAADRYGRLADLVKRHKVSRVSDLPRRVLDVDDWQVAA